MREKIEELSTELLTKRKKFAVFILGVLFGVAVFVIITAFWTGRYNTLLAVVALVGVSIPMINGLRRINAELTKRCEDSG